jgi:glycosyltransferase involved in cell wall biosynthesis
MVLYISPLARGGVDVWMRNIHRAMVQSRVPNQLRMLPHLYNFFPFLARLSLRGNWPGPARLVHSGSRAGFALRARGRPLVVTVHHLVADPTYRPYTRPAQRLFHRLERLYDGLSISRADTVACVSDYTRGRVVELYGREDARVVHNGIDTDLFRPMPAQRPAGWPFRLLFVGNRTRRKGADLLEPLMARLGEGYELRYTGGQRDDEVPVRAPAAVALGRLSLQDLARAYNSCHALIFPSRLEGFGLAVAEAMACGLPAVVSRCSSLPELVVEGQGGFLCPLDDVDALAEAVRRLAEDPALCREMGAFNRARAERLFSFAQMAGGYRELYAELDPSFGGTDGD